MISGTAAAIELEVKDWMHQGSVMSTFLFAVVVDVVIELAREGGSSESLNADDLLRQLRDSGISSDIEESFESYGLQVHHWKTKVMVSGGTTKDGLSKVKMTHVGSVV